jgi:very-short-patch-repair endonuclease
LGLLAQVPSTSARTVLEDRFLGNWTALGGPQLAREYRFDTIRRWRFDFALAGCKIAIEINGGLYAPQTGHRSMAGVERDYEKLNAAQLQGWQVFQISSKAVGDVPFLEKLIEYCKLMG